MPESETRLITLTEDELQRMVERGANLGGQEAISSLEDKLRDLEKKVEQMAITQKLVPEHVLLSWLKVSRKTLKRWDVPVDSKQGQTRFYHMPTVIGHLRGTHEDEEGGAERKYTLKVAE